MSANIDINNDYLCKKKSQNYTGMTSMFDKDVAINAVLYVAERIGDRKDMHKIFKTLYFSDKYHLSKYGRTITGDNYIAMEHGPVPSKIDDIFKAVRGDSFFQAGELIRYFHFVNRFMIEPNISADLDYLSESDIECLDEAISLCKDKSFDELVVLSHDYAWNETKRNRTMSVGNILRECGDSEEYIDYINNNIRFEKDFCNATTY